MAARSQGQHPNIAKQSCTSFPNLALGITQGHGRHILFVKVELPHPLSKRNRLHLLVGSSKALEQFVELEMWPVFENSLAQPISFLS